jgi:hypothetical protein
MRGRQRNPWDIYADEHNIDAAREPKPTAPPKTTAPPGNRQQCGGLFDRWERRGERQRTGAHERSPVVRELRIIRFGLAVILILLGLWLSGVFNGTSGTAGRVVETHFHGYIEARPEP